MDTVLLTFKHAVRSCLRFKKLETVAPDDSWANRNYYENTTSPELLEKSIVQNVIVGLQRNAFSMNIAGWLCDS